MGLGSVGGGWDTEETESKTDFPLQDLPFWGHQ